MLYYFFIKIKGNVMKTLLATASIISLLSGAVIAKENIDTLGAYVGLSKHLSSGKFERKHRSGFLRKVYGNGSIYAGFKLSDNFGVEAGYESTLVRISNLKISEKECSTLYLVPYVYERPMINLRTKIKGPYIGLTMFHKLGDSPVSILGSAGVSLIKGTAECEGIKVGRLVIQGTDFKLSHQKEVFRFMGGAQYLTESKIGFRGVVSVLKGHTMRFHTSDKITVVESHTIKAKDTAVCSFGMFYEF